MLRATLYCPLRRQLATMTSLSKTPVEDVIRAKARRRHGVFVTAKLIHYVDHGRTETFRFTDLQ